MRPALLLPAVVAALLAGCTDAPGDTGADERVRVVAAPYAYAWVAERVGGDRVEVSDLTPAAGQAHDLELTPSQVGAVAEADLVVHSRGLSPALDRAVDAGAPGRALDALSVVEVRGAPDGDDHGGDSTDEHDHGPGDTHDDADASSDNGHDHSGEDPHAWLDPVRLGQVATAVGERLAEVDGEHADGYRARAEELVAELTALDEELATGLARCDRRDVVTGHDAFGYLTDRYGLQQVPVGGLSPEQEPSPQALARAVRTARERGVTTVFAEALLSPRVAEQLAREVGAEVSVLSTLEAAPEEGDYLTAMRENLAALRTGLGCG